jgi:hypothetical protein
MSLNRIIYNAEALYVGPSPSSGQHFVDIYGNLNDYYWSGDNNYNLIRPVTRVQAINYGINFDRTEIKQLGSRSLAAFPLIQYPTINLDFSYLSAGIANEYRLGLDVNYQQLNITKSGQTVYSDNYSICCISGLLDRNLNWDGDRYRFSYQDKKNYFICVNKSGEDVNQFNTSQKPNFSALDVYCFGDAQINSYHARGAVGEFPVVNVSLISDNLTIYGSGSGINIPALDPVTRNSSNFRAVIPSSFDGSFVSTLLPSDTTVNITSYKKAQNVLVIPGTGLLDSVAVSRIPDIGIDFQNLAVQSYDIGFDLNREPLISLTSKLPIDRRITFPVYATCNLSVLFNNNITGNLNHLFNKDDDYNVSLRLKNGHRPGIGIQYDLRRAKLNGFSAAGQIGSNKSANLNFVSEINPDNLSGGFFISGSLNQTPVQKLTGFLQLDDGSYLLLEDGVSRIILYDTIII